MSVYIEQQLTKKKVQQCENVDKFVLIKKITLEKTTLVIPYRITLSREPCITQEYLHN